MRGAGRLCQPCHPAPEGPGHAGLAWGEKPASAAAPQTPRWGAALPCRGRQICRQCDPSGDSAGQMSRSRISRLIRTTRSPHRIAWVWPGPRRNESPSAPETRVPGKGSASSKRDQRRPAKWLHRHRITSGACVAWACSFSARGADRAGVPHKRFLPDMVRPLASSPFRQPPVGERPMAITTSSSRQQAPLPSHPTCSQ